MRGAVAEASGPWRASRRSLHIVVIQLCCLNPLQDLLFHLLLCHLQMLHSFCSYVDNMLLSKSANFNTQHQK